jgi:hypothetical protein
MRLSTWLVVLLCAGCVVQPPPAPYAAPPPADAAPPPAAPAATGQGCREFDTPVVIGGQEQQAHGTACLQPDGSWRIVQELPGQPAQSYVLPPQAYAPYYPPAYAADPWFYGPPLFLGGVFIGGGWGHRHHHDGFRGAWRGGGRFRR